MDPSRGAQFAFVIAEGVLGVDSDTKEEFSSIAARAGVVALSGALGKSTSSETGKQRQGPSSAFINI